MATPHGYEAPGRVWEAAEGSIRTETESQIWNASIDAYLKRNGFRPLAADPCIYVWRSTNGKINLGLYVDVLLLAVSTSLMIWIKVRLNKRCRITDLG